MTEVDSTGGMETVVYALHKPNRMECIRTEAPKALPTAKQVELQRRNCLTRWLMELEAIEGCSLHAVGRLDKDTTGLLLVTNDGKLTNLLLRPGFCSKIYIADCNGIPDSAKLTKLQDGSIEISDKRNKKGKALRRDENGCYEILRVKSERVEVMATWTKTHNEFQTHFCRLRLEMRTGQFRVVRRMLAAVGLCVNRLHRESIGDLVLRNIPPPNTSENMSEIYGSYESTGYMGTNISEEKIVLDVQQSSHTKLSNEMLHRLKWIAEIQDCGKTESTKDNRSTEFNNQDGSSECRGRSRSRSRSRS